MEECLEFAREDECAEVMPEVTRIRKLELDSSLRARDGANRKPDSRSQLGQSELKFRETSLVVEGSCNCGNIFGVSPFPNDVSV